MPPTPENFLINPQTINVQAPQVQQQITPQPEYKEAEVSMPAPQQWIGGIDYGFNWSAVGAKAFEVGGKIYESLLQYSQRRRKEYAEDDLNNIQSIAVEKPDPSLNLYGTENFYKTQRNKLKNATRNALKKQGFSEEQIIKMLPEEGEATLNPSDLQLPSSDMENVLKLTRYNTLTDQEFVNTINRYNNEIWETSYNNFLDQAVNKRFGTVDPNMTPSDLKASYMETQQRLLDATDNRQDRAEQATMALEQYPMSNYLLKSVENVDIKLSEVRDKQINASLDSLIRGDISEDAFIDTVLKLEEQKKKDLTAIVFNLDESVDVESNLELRTQERINENPDTPYELKKSVIQYLDQNIFRISEELTTETDINKITRLQKQQTLLVEQREKVLKDIIEKTPSVLLKAENQRSFVDLNKQYQDMVTKSAQDQIQQITEKTVVQNIQQYSAVLNGLEQDIEEINNYRARLKTSKLPTPSEYLQLNDVSDVKFLSKSKQIVYKVLQENDETRVLESFDTVGGQEKLKQLAMVQSLKEAGIYTDTQGNPILKNEAQRLFWKHVMDTKGAGTGNSSVGFEVNRKTKETISRDKDTFKIQQLAAGGVGLTQKDVTDTQRLLIQQVLQGEERNPKNAAALFKKYSRDGAVDLAFILGDRKNRESLIEIFLQDPEGFNRNDLAVFNQKLTQDALSLGKDNVNRENLLTLGRFVNFVGNRIPSGTEQGVAAITKANPQVLVREFEGFENRYQQTLRTLQSGVADKDLITVYQAANTLWNGGTGITMGGNQLWDSLNKYPQFQPALELYSEKLNQDYFFDTDQLKGLVTSSNDTDDLLTPFVIAQVTAPQGSTPEQIVEQALAIFPMYGSRLGKTIGADGTVVPVVTKDPHGKLKHEQGDPLSPNIGDPEVTVSPVIATARTYESIVYGKIPNTLYKNGKQYLPDSQEETEKYKISKENMIEIMASAYPGLASVSQVKQDKITVDVMEALMDLFDKYPTADERIKRYDPRIEKWVYQYQADKNRKDAPSVVSRANFILDVLLSDGLTGKHALELGLNASSHSGLNLTNEELNIKRRFYRLEQFDGVPLRASEEKYQADLQSPDLVVTNQNGIGIAEPSFGEPVILRHPVTKEKINVNIAENTSFGISYNRAMEKPYSQEWLDSQTGTTWEWINLETNKLFTPLFPTNTYKNFEPNLNILESITWDQEANAFKYTSITLGTTGTETEKVSYLMPRVLKKQADNTPKYDTILRNQIYQDSQGNIKTPANQMQSTQVSPGTVSDKPYIDLISEFEGIRTDAYWDDTGKVWTIGKGTTTYRDGTPVKKGDKISKEEANNLMQDFVDTKIIPTLEETIPTWNEMNQNQRAALISFAYNVGPNFYNRKGFESITKAVSSVDTFNQVPEALKKYNKSSGKVLNGLTKRREAEANLWSSSKEKKFNAEESDYDYVTAEASGMKPDNTGHWGSVTNASIEDKKKYKLPDESYIILKGKKHRTWNLMEKAEEERGFKIVKHGDRYYSVPK